LPGQDLFRFLLLTASINLGASCAARFVIRAVLSRQYLSRPPLQDRDFSLLLCLLGSAPAMGHVGFAGRWLPNVVKVVEMENGAGGRFFVDAVCLSLGFSPEELRASI